MTLECSDFLLEDTRAVESLGCHLVPSFLPQSKLAAHEAVTIAQSVLQELLRGISTPERAPSPVDAYLTEEDLFHYRNPRVWVGPARSG